MGTLLKDLQSFLETLPCVCEEGRGHTKYILKVNNRVVAWTYYSRSWRGSTQIDDSIVSKQAKQMKCSSNTLWKKLLSRQVPKEAYFGDLLTYGHINQNEYDILCGKNLNR
jgi:hypothetical protein